MTELERFRGRLLDAVQQLGPEPSLDQVNQAIADLKRGGVPEGASFEGLLIQRSLAEMREAPGPTGWDVEFS